MKLNIPGISEQLKLIIRGFLVIGIACYRGNILTDEGFFT